ncbi:flagellar biosynthesis protein FliQ [Treponema pedis]|uniref:Flagellar biosynthetic protein FliQ n=2 Tax=Treponema pedis TaxID=409322 RepID=S5ZTZ2_9SPIR|nr:flagellar biosynthesis protein FliQ [Treponema pedis]AGT43615.1 flagellar biosynthetic protein FliQ [Treponema pedis str. T A4]QOW61143.1 flagellar biosynthesis protein FliQ [Treponema pedis]QSI04401.1 flagellar biosynthetic protein FliQ [Treponema pedis]
MSIGTIVTLMREGIWVVLVISAPILIAALLVGLIVAIFQATTSIQEQTLTFVPKIFTILGMLALLAGWIFAVLRGYFISLMDLIPQLVR